MRLEGIEFPDPYLRCPAATDLVEKRRAERHHFVAPRCHLQPLEARVARVRLPVHVSELLKGGDRLDTRPTDFVKTPEFRFVMRRVRRE